MNFDTYSSDQDYLAEEFEKVKIGELTEEEDVELLPDTEIASSCKKIIQNRRRNGKILPPSLAEEM